MNCVKRQRSGCVPIWDLVPVFVFKSWGKRQKELSDISLSQTNCAGVINEHCVFIERSFSLIEHILEHNLVRNTFSVVYNEGNILYYNCSIGR